MDTELGARRRVSDPPPTVHPPLTCDIKAQDCDDGLGCYAVEHFQTACGLSRGFAKDADCLEATDCAPGLACASSNSSASTFQCEPYCDPSDGATNGCSTACANSYKLLTIDNVTVTGICLAP